MIDENIKYCKYYKPRMATLLEYCRCLYKLEGCICGGLLHILLDDDNYDTNSILFCLRECITHPEEEESELGILICKELLKMSIEERTLFDWMWNAEGVEYCNSDKCKGCRFITPDDFIMESESHHI